MGASDSKLVFKKEIFRLSEERNIRADDPYWTSFWELPQSTEDVFSLFSPADIRRTRDSAPENLETLILAVTSRLFILRHHPSFPDPDFAPEQDALNCIRILTRVLPYIYEIDSLQEWEDKFFWGARRKRTRRSTIQAEVLFDDKEEERGAKAEDEFEDVRPLAEELIDTLIDMLFFAEFTLPRSTAGKSKVSYAIWQSGVGCNTPVATSREFESNRSEILRLLLTLTSKSMYTTANMLPVVGVRALSYIVTCPDKQIVLSVLCSLLNTALKYNPASWRVPYGSMMYKDPKQTLVTYALQFLLVVLLYTVPEDNVVHNRKNYYRHFLGRLHRPQDFQFINDGMTRILNQPVLASTSYLPGNQVSMKFSSEMIMLFWEITQCNKRFRSFIIDTERSHDFVILILFYAQEHKLDNAKQGLVRMCVFLLQTLSVEPNFGPGLNKKFEVQDTLPPSIRLLNFDGTYADHLIQNIYSLITTSNGKLTAVYPALLAIINNVAAYLQGLNATTSAKLMQLYSSMASPSFLLANDSNHRLLQALLEAMNAVIEHQYSKNPNFLYAIVRNKQRFEALRNFTLEGGQEEIERSIRRRKENPAGSLDTIDAFARESVDSVRSPSNPHNPTLENVPENGTFTIGDDEDESDDDQSPAQAANTPSSVRSRPSSVSSTIEDAVPTQLRGMSEKARGKMPAGAPTFSRQNSSMSLGGYSSAGGGSDVFAPTPQWIESWLPELPLHTILWTLQELSDVVTDSSSIPNKFIERIKKPRSASSDVSAIRIHTFEWTPLSLGWYESLLWAFIFQAEMQVAKGTVGVWNGTSIKLFRVQETTPEGPSLSSPRGAVDAVGSNIMSRVGSMSIGGMSLRGSALGNPESRQQTGRTSGEEASSRNGRPLTVRSAIV